LRARSELLMALQEWVKTQNKTQVEAAKILGVTQPRMSDPAPAPGARHPGGMPDQAVGRAPERGIA